MTATTPTTPLLSGVNKAGLAIAFLLGTGSVVGVFRPTPKGQVGPPLAVLLLDAALGLIIMVAVVVAWRTARRAAIRLAAGARILSMITALPAFFVPVPAWVKVWVGVGIVLTVLAIVLMFAPARRPAPVTD
jgi:hypothetical protein